MGLEIGLNILEKSWKSFGKSLEKMCGNPVTVKGCIRMSLHDMGCTSWLADDTEMSQKHEMAPGLLWNTLTFIVCRIFTSLTVHVQKYQEYTILALI